MGQMPEEEVQGVAPLGHQAPLSSEVCSRLVLDFRSFLGLWGGFGVLYSGA